VGVVPAGWDNVVVTSHFKVYVPDTARLDPRFFRLLLQTREFKAWLWANRSGADGRTEVKLNVFEALEIPLPPLAEQTALCNAYNDALTRAVLLEQEAKAIEDAGLRVFEDALGMATPPPVPDRPLVIARFRDMDRWTPEAVLASGCGHTPGPPRFPTAKLRALIAGIEVGWSPKCLERSASEEEWGVLKLSAITTGTFDPTANKALSPKFAPRPGIEVKAGDVLITRGSGIARLVGATVLVGSAVRSRLMVCDLIFRVRFLGDTPIVPGYLVRVLRTTDLRRQIEERRTGAPPMMQKITKSALLDLDVPIPDIGTQRAFVRGLEKTAIAAGEKRTEAATLRQSAWSAFEAALFGPAT
jgi:type I restriction enzyme S subunit